MSGILDRDDGYALGDPKRIPDQSFEPTRTKPTTDLTVVVPDTLLDVRSERKWAKPADYAKRCRITEAGRFMKSWQETDDGCWEWTLHIAENGYGRFKWAGKFGAAHRFSFELLVGPIPDGLQLDHLCRNRACVNPDHLEAVTGRENTMRGIGPGAINAAKTHCPYGHPYNEANTYHYRGARGCKNCRRNEVRRRRREGKP